MDENQPNPAIAPDAGMERRRHPRRTVLKTAVVFPVIKQVGFSVENISQGGMSGQCALDLSVRQLVHISFDDSAYLAAEVRWANGRNYGLMMEDALLAPNFDEPPPPDIGLTQRSVRVAVDLAATLVVTGPMLAGTVRNMSIEGMMVEIGGRVAEGELLLIRAKGQHTLLGRVQWSSGPMAGVFFERR